MITTEMGNHMPAERFIWTASSELRIVSPSRGQALTSIGADPVGDGNPQLLINSDLLKQLLYGPIAGPPRNSIGIGQPG